MKAQLGTDAPYRDINSDETRVGKLEGDPLEFYEALQRSTDVERDVPCRGCKECCWHGRVPVDPEQETAESLAHLSLQRQYSASPTDTVEKYDGLVLRKREDGACVHLGPDGCTVYEHRPRACRGYDCRLYALTGVLDKYDGDHRSPVWVFKPNTEKSRAFMATCQIVGQAELQYHREDGLRADATTIFKAVFNSPLFEEVFSLNCRLAEMTPPEIAETLGVDPTTIDLTRADFISMAKQYCDMLLINAAQDTT